MIAVIMLIVYQVVGQFVLFSIVLNKAEDVCIQRLGDAAEEFSSNFYEHAMSDREQLRVVADMLTVLMEEGSHDLNIHLAAFEQRGMLDWLQVLFPDGTLVTGSGTYNVSDQCSYSAELDKAPFISNISAGYVDSTKRVIRSAVPITSDGQTIAILYGVYDLTAGHILEGATAFDNQCYTFVIESDTGSYILDDLSRLQSAAHTGESYESKPGYDLEKLADDLAACREGYSAFRSRTIDDYMYIYYTPIGINQWMTMVSVPDHVALAYVHQSREIIIGSIMYLSLGVIIYFIVLYRVDQKLHNKNIFVTGIQSRLMEVYHKPEYYRDSLKAVADRTRCQALFIADEQLPSANAFISSNAALASAFQAIESELNNELLALCREHRKNVLFRIKQHNMQHCPQLKLFMQEHYFSSLALVPVLSADGSIHQYMVAFDPQNPDALVLLGTVAVDFFMAASSINHFQRMQIASTVDGLTQTMNRASYHVRTGDLSTRTVQQLACVYIDVNDLHAINNRFGHEKGDAMLITIASALTDAFGQKNVFRFGGDEFVVFKEHTTRETVEQQLAAAMKRINDEGYYISVGVSWSQQVNDLDELIREAENLMYKDKYRFYQEKEQQAAMPNLEHKAVRRLLTENEDVNAFLAVAESRYRGAYVVDLKTDEAREIIGQHDFHLALQAGNNLFTNAFKQYLAERVDKQSRRSVQNFFNHRQIGDQLAAGVSPTVEYTKIGGERIRLTVHRSARYSEQTPETLWVFERTL